MARRKPKETQHPAQTAINMALSRLGWETRAASSQAAHCELFPNDSRRCDALATKAAQLERAEARINGVLEELISGVPSCGCGESNGAE